MPVRVPVEKRREQCFSELLQNVKDATERYQKDDGTFSDEKLYRMELKKDIRLMREIFELYNPSMLRFMDFPEVGECTASLRLKRERHVEAAVTALQTYASIQIQEAKKDHEAKSTGALELKKRTLISGLFFICIIIAAYSLYKDENPPLTWTILLCGMWSAGAWLWNQEIASKYGGKVFSRIKRLLMVLLKVFGFPVAACTIFYIYTSSLEHNKGRSVLSGTLSLAAIIMVAEIMGFVYYKSFDER